MESGKMDVLVALKGGDIMKSDCVLHVKVLS